MYNVHLPIMLESECQAVYIERKKDIICKTADDNNMDVYLNQYFVATSFALSECTKYSPYFLLHYRISTL